MQMYVVVFFKLNVNLTFRSAYLTSGNNVIGMQQQRRWSEQISLLTTTQHKTFRNVPFQNTLAGNSQHNLNLQP